MAADGGLGNLMARLDDVAKLLGGQGQAMADLSLTFPEIAVVGQQSTGKSSVLERLTMLPLFPRGKDIVTRMPLKLRLIHLSEDELAAFCAEQKLVSSDSSFYIRICICRMDGRDQQAPEWSPWEGPLHSGQESVQSEHPTRIINEIMKACTTGPDGTNLGVNDELCIKIEVRSRSVPNLALVDLPGIVGGKARGEPDDMAQRTENLVANYLTANSPLVLIVTEGGSSSVCNSRAFDVVNRCGKVKQSMVVLTKCDNCVGDMLDTLVERLEGTAPDCTDVGYGYVGVVNRSVRTAKSLTQAAADEKEWFEANLPGAIEKERASGEVLLARLVKMLIHHILERWAKNASESILVGVRDKTEELAQLGDLVPEDEAGQMELALRILTRVRAGMASVVLPGGPTCGIQQLPDVMTGLLGQVWDTRQWSSPLDARTMSLFISCPLMRSVREKLKAGLPEFEDDENTWHQLLYAGASQPVVAASYDILAAHLLEMVPTLLESAMDSVIEQLCSAAFSTNAEQLPDKVSRFQLLRAILKQTMGPRALAMKDAINESVSAELRKSCGMGASQLALAHGNRMPFYCYGHEHTPNYIIIRDACNSLLAGIDRAMMLLSYHLVALPEFRTPATLLDALVLSAPFYVDVGDQAPLIPHGLLKTRAGAVAFLLTESCAAQRATLEGMKRRLDEALHRIEELNRLAPPQGAAC